MHPPEEEREFRNLPSEVVGTALGYVSIILGVGCLLLSPLFFASRFCGFFISFGIERLFLAFNRERIVFKIRSIRVALLSGKIVIEGFQYTNKDISIHFSYCVIQLRWWLRKVLTFPEDGFNTKSRVEIGIEGLEYLIFNNSEHFSRLQAILERRTATEDLIARHVESKWKYLLKRIFEAIIPKSETNTTDEAQEANLPAEEVEEAVLPSFFDVIPTVVVRIVAAAVVLGSEDLPKMAVLTFKNGKGTYYRTEKSRNLYSYTWDFVIDKPRAYIAPDPRSARRKWKQHFKPQETQMKSDEWNDDADDVQHAGGFSRKVIIETLALFKLYYRDMHFEFLGPDVYRTAASMGEGSRDVNDISEISLCRPEGGDDAVLDVEDVLRCESLDLKYYIDDPGIVGPADCEDNMPLWGISLVLKGENTNITYGPAHDRLRDEMMNIFLAFEYENWQIYEPKSGEERKYQSFKVDLVFKDKALVRLPFNPLKKKGNRDPDPLQWTTLHCGTESNLSVTIPWEAISSEGTAKKIKGRLNDVEVFTSHEINFDENMQSACIISAPKLDIDISLGTPIAWNDLSIWDFKLVFDQPNLTFLRAHLDLLFSLSADWSFADSPPEFATFMPAWYRFDVVFNQFHWFFNSTDRNVVADPSRVENYPQVLFKGDSLKLGTVIESDQFGKEVQEIPFSLGISDLDVQILLPHEHAPYSHLSRSPFLSSKTFDLAIKYRYYYAERVKHGEIDSLSMLLNASNVVTTVYGFGLRRVLGFVENYFGEYQQWAPTFIDREELRAKNDHPVRPFELRLNASFSNTEIRLPLTLAETPLPAYLKISIQDTGVEMRNTDTFMDTFLTLGPLKLGSNGACKAGLEEDFTASKSMFERFGNEEHCCLVIDGISLSMFHLYGPAPLYSCFRSKWRAQVGEISGEVLPEQMLGLMSWWDHFKFFKNLYDNARVLDRLIDVITLDTGKVNFGIWSPAGLTEIYMKNGVCLETDTLVNSMYHEKLLLLLPSFRLRHLSVMNDSESSDDSESEWQELFQLDASFYLSLLDRYPNWSADFDKQIEFLEKNSIGREGLLESLSPLSVRNVMESKAEESDIPFVFEMWDEDKDALWRRIKGSPQPFRRRSSSKESQSSYASFDPVGPGVLKTDYSLFPVFKWDPAAGNLPEKIDPPEPDILSPASGSRDASFNDADSTGYLDTDIDGSILGGVAAYRASYIIQLTRPMRITTCSEFVESIPSLASAFLRANESWGPAIPVEVPVVPNDVAIQIPAVFLTIAQSSSNDVSFNGHLTIGDIRAFLQSPALVDPTVIPKCEPEYESDNESDTSVRISPSRHCLSYSQHDSTLIKVGTLQAVITMQRPRMKKFVSISNSTRPALRVEAPSSDLSEVPAFLNTASIPPSMTNASPVLVFGVNNVVFSSIEAKDRFLEPELSSRFNMNELKCKNSVMSLSLGDLDVMMSMSLSPGAIESLSMTWMETIAAVSSRMSSGSAEPVYSGEIVRMDASTGAIGLLLCGADASAPNRMELESISANSVRVEESSDILVHVQGFKTVVDPSIQDFATALATVFEKLRFSSNESKPVAALEQKTRDNIALIVADTECDILGKQGRALRGTIPLISVTMVAEPQKKENKISGQSTFVQLAKSKLSLCSDQQSDLVTGVFPFISAHLIQVVPRGNSLKRETVLQLSLTDSDLSLPHPVWKKVQQINAFLNDWSDGLPRSIPRSASDRSTPSLSSSTPHLVPSVRKTVQSVVTSRMRITVVISSLQIRIQLLKQLACRYVLSNARAHFEEEDRVRGSSKSSIQIQRGGVCISSHEIMFSHSGSTVQEGVFNLPGIKATLADDLNGTRIATILDPVHSVATESMFYGLLALQSSLQSDVDEVLTTSLDFVESWKPQIPSSSESTATETISVSNIPPKRFRVQARVVDFAVTLEANSGTLHVATGPIDIEYDSVPQIDDISGIDGNIVEKEIADLSETEETTSDASGPTSSFVDARTDSVASFGSSGIRASTVGKGRYIIGRRHSHFDVRTTATTILLAPPPCTSSGLVGPASFKSDLSSVKCGLRVTSFPQDLEGWSSWGDGVHIPMAVATAAAADTEAWKASAGRLAQIWIMIEHFEVTVRPALWVTAVNLMKTYEDAVSKVAPKPDPVPFAKARQSHHLPPPTPVRRLATKMQERSRSRIKYEAKRARSTDVSVYLFTKDLKVTFPIKSLNPEVTKAREARMLGISVASAATVVPEIEEACSLDLQWLAIRAHRLSEMRRIGAGDQRISVDIAALSLVAPENPEPLARASIRRIALRVSMRQRVPIKILSYVGMPSIDIHATAAPVLFALLRDWETGLVAKTGQLGKATAEIIRTGTYGGEEKETGETEQSEEPTPVKHTQGINLDLTLRVGRGNCILRAAGDRVSKRIDFGVGRDSRESLPLITPPVVIRLQARPRPLDDRSLSSAEMNISVVIGERNSIRNKDFVIVITPTLVPFLETFSKASKKSEAWAITALAESGTKKDTAVTDDRVEVVASLQQKIVVRFQEGLDDGYSSSLLRCDVSMRDLDFAYASASRFNKHNPNVRLVMPTMLTMSLGEVSLSVRSPFFDHDSLNFGVVNVLGSYVPAISGARPSSVGTALLAAQKIRVSVAYHALSAVVDVLKMFGAPVLLRKRPEEPIDTAQNNVHNTVSEASSVDISSTSSSKVFAYMTFGSLELDVSNLPSIGRFQAQIARLSFRHSDQSWLAKASSDAAITCFCARRIYAGFVPGLLDAHLIIGNEKPGKQGAVEKRPSLSISSQGSTDSGALTMFYARRRAESFPIGDWTISAPPAIIHIDYKRAPILRLETVEISARIRDLTTEILWQQLLMGEIEESDIMNLKEKNEISPVINASLFLRCISLSMATRAVHEFGDIGKIFGFVVSGFKRVIGELVKDEVEETGSEMWLKRGILRDDHAVVTLSGVLDSHELALRTGAGSGNVDIEKYVPEGTIVIHGSDFGVALFDKLTSVQCVYDHIDEFQFVLRESVNAQDAEVIRSVDGTSMANFVIENRSKLAPLGFHSQRQIERFGSEMKNEEVIGIPYLAIRSTSSQKIGSNEVYCDWESDFRGKPLRVKTVFALLNRVKNVHLKLGESSGKSSTTSGGGRTGASSDGDYTKALSQSMSIGKASPEGIVYKKKNPNVPYAFPALPLKCVGEKVTLGELLNYLGVVSAEELVVATHGGMADALSSLLFAIHSAVSDLRRNTKSVEEES